MAAQALGERVLWTGFLGGSTGAECERGLVALGIDVAVVKIAAATRTNLEIIESNGTVTEVLEPGGAITERDAERMLTLCRDLFCENRNTATVAISGSLPPGAPDDFYAEIIRLAHSHGCSVLLDTSGEALRKALPARPDLVKSNREEAEMLAGVSIPNAGSAAKAASIFFESGARSVAVSLGRDGIFWQTTPDAIPLLAQAPGVDSQSTVGCGDSSLAGFTVAQRQGLPAEEIVRIAAACGTANCLAEAPGMIRREDVDRITPQVSVRTAF
jgi:1-phosphofructokinase family hexose kinase